jgi:hypothetical protein
MEEPVDTAVQTHPSNLERQRAWDGDAGTYWADCRSLPASARLTGPFSLSDPGRVQHLLASAGFVDVRLQGLNEPMYFGPDPDDACRFISGQFAGMVQNLDGGARSRAINDGCSGRILRRPAHHSLPPRPGGSQ